MTKISILVKFKLAKIRMAMAQHLLSLHVMHMTIPHQHVLVPLLGFDQPREHHNLLLNWYHLTQPQFKDSKYVTPSNHQVN
jgi:ABC-type glycerol-3-phosphate transport system permease component